MPELQMDVAVANRFISSLSKSLQALCHGCMDFDSGIEIVGYINVNIDCGSKVDYVLNEKVLKSTTNSMTFVSNSFLARKEQQKQTRDDTCSPIRELNQPPPSMSSFQSRARGYLHGMHSRSGTGPVSHSYGHHGSQKRSWTGMDKDSRMSPKKSRDVRPSLHESASTAQRTHSNPTSSSFSQNSADAKFMWPQTSFQGSETNTDSHEEVNIKKELLESDSGKEIDQSEQDHSQTEQDEKDNTDQIPRVPNIKCDPDASTAISNEETGADGSANVTDDDYKGTFLDPSTSEKNEDTLEQTTSQTETNDDIENTATGSLQQSEDSAVAEDVQAENVAGSEAAADFDETGEEGTYPHSVYSDAGEGSNDAGQFEVIEIEDEDEDVQAMFGEPHRRMPSTPNRELQAFARHTRIQQYGVSPSVAKSMVHSGSSSSTPHTFQCPNCQETFLDSCEFKSHMSNMHGTEFPFVCTLCGKGYLSSSGLYRHIRVHKGQMTFCTICDSKFTQSSTLRRHLITVHSLMPCSVCKDLLRLGVEYNSHKQTCGKYGLKPEQASFTQWNN